MLFTSKPRSKILLNIQLILLLVASTISYADTVIKPGSILIVNEPIRVAAGSAWVYIQNGQAGRYNIIDQYYANCRMEMKRPANKTRIIQPDQFIISRIATTIESVLAKPIVMASLGYNMSFSATADNYITIFYLKSSKQPDVELMSCQHWEDPTVFPKFLTSKQIIETLGALVTIKTQ